MIPTWVIERNKRIISEYKAIFWLILHSPGNDFSVHLPRNWQNRIRWQKGKSEIIGNILLYSHYPNYITRQIFCLLNSHITSKCHLKTMIWPGKYRNSQYFCFFLVREEREGWGWSDLLHFHSFQGLLHQFSSSFVFQNCLVCYQQHHNKIK